MSRVTVVTIILTLVAACSEDVPLGGGDASPAIDAPASFTVTIGTSGAGRVVSSPAGIDCGADCSEVYPFGTVVQLVATPTAGSSFLGWSGGGCAGTGICAVVLNADTAVTATFDTVSTVLVVTKSGTGTGTVSSSPAGIACGADCSEGFPFGTVVQLVATPTAGSSFLGWSGGGCTGTGTCTVTIAGSVTVDARFDLGCSLTTLRSGPGLGTIVSTPGGINCGSACQAAIPCGTIVTLTASPAAGSSFTGWTGAGCSGTGTCAVSITGDITVAGNFSMP